MTGERRSAAERKEERLRALLYLAEQDTEAAKLLAARDNHYAAYHCQQAAEKLIATQRPEAASPRPPMLLAWRRMPHTFPN